MIDREMLSAISELLDEKLEGLKTDVSGLKSDMRYVKEMLLEGVILKLSRIESCHLDRIRRYAEYTEKFYKMAANIEILNHIVAEHSRKLEKIPG